MSGGGLRTVACKFLIQTEVQLRALLDGVLRGCVTEAEIRLRLDELKKAGPAGAAEAFDDCGMNLHRIVKHFDEMREMARLPPQRIPDKGGTRSPRSP